MINVNINIYHIDWNKLTFTKDNLQFYNVGTKIKEQGIRHGTREWRKPRKNRTSNQLNQDSNLCFRTALGPFKFATRNNTQIFILADIKVYKHSYNDYMSNCNLNMGKYHHSIQCHEITSTCQITFCHLANLSPNSL